MSILSKTNLMKSNTESTEKHPYLKCLGAIAELSKSVYAKGSLPERRQLTVAVVGTRKPTAYGTRTACEIAEYLAQRGVVVISGLAYGVDRAAHEGTLRAGGITIAVLAHGLDVVYPRHHESLATRILDNGGALLSPYPDGTPVARFRFLERNQWIAGLADAVVVIEAEHRSGTQATVRYALDYGKEVFAVPGNITTPQAAGPNRLIKEGAHPVTQPADILQVLAPELIQRPSPDSRQTPISEKERLVIEALHQGAASVDQLIATTQLSINELLALLTALELQGAIAKNNVGAWYCID